MKELRCLGRPLDGRFADDGEAPTVFLENTAGDNNLELVTDHRLPPVAVHYRKIRINSDDGESVDCWVADGMTFDDAIVRYKDIEPLSPMLPGPQLFTGTIPTEGSQAKA